MVWSQDRHFPLFSVTLYRAWRWARDLRVLLSKSSFAVALPPASEQAARQIEGRLWSMTCSCMWGTDWTRAVKLPTYKEGVQAFRVTDRLSDNDRAVLMGETRGAGV
jgi:hypothetical protein